MLLAVAGWLALLGILNDPDRSGRLSLVAACDFIVASFGLLLPWGRFNVHAPALLGLVAFGVLGLSTWSFGGVATGTGPFLVLLYAWAALHFPRWILLLYLVPSTLAYLVPLIITDQPQAILGSAVVLMPIALSVALLIEAQARHLRDDRARLARIEQWRAGMVSTLAHDVRAPLSTVRGVLEELEDAAGGHERKMIEAALRQTARIARLADGLLDLDRIDSSGHLKLDLGSHPAHSLVKEALLYVRADADIQVEIDESLAVWVDKMRFEQILLNLVTNAMRYGAPPIIVRITREGGFDRLEVRDHGPGIPDELRNRLFGQFAVGGAQGVGLGLWIVRQLAVAHGGNAVAEAREPGVAMVVTFPIHQSP
ncbi:signal transduction histidine kinase [Actinoplanes lutulentus]|uniref:histidine kinase n=1 Tax=Actinoplanes lutulentus TaxID=1287878 RepID=A0A327Z9Q3_9ACTN|nr:HAMP domain-containing sensor histidine kinase [Actinoplanes lutulentus]MBB2947491.1 signal transduction histidine kinase [Actinoplanes lutulentus]RAK28097.1 signal transduction histidine kinase [Actinoplanes lutulentus]